MGRDVCKPDSDELVTVAKLDAEGFERLKDAVWCIQQAYPSITIQWALRRGMRLVTRELEAHHNGGEEFEPRPMDIEQLDRAVADDASKQGRALYAVEHREDIEKIREAIRTGAPSEPATLYAKLDVQQLDWLRDAIWWARQSRPGLTLHWALRRGMRLVLRELELYHNDGKGFAPREQEHLPRGRRKPGDLCRFEAIE